jgi:hypothetical protein
MSLWQMKQILIQGFILFLVLCEHMLVSALVAEEDSFRQMPMICFVGTIAQFVCAVRGETQPLVWSCFLYLISALVAEISAPDARFHCCFHLYSFLIVRPSLYTFTILSPF